MSAGQKRGRSNSKGDESADILPAAKEPRVDGKTAAGALDVSAMAALQASVAAQIAAASQALQAKQAGAATAAPASTLPPVAPPSKKATHYTLRVDAQGREVDEHGKVIAHVAKPIRTVAANRRWDEKKEKALLSVKKEAKKMNPYLAHLSEDAAVKDGGSAVDLRIHMASRDMHARKALQFVEPGSYVLKEELQKERFEERQRLGTGSGRGLHPQLVEREGATAAASSAEKDAKLVESATSIPVGQPCDAGMVPLVEWWDLDFLPREYRDQLGLKKGASVPQNLPGLDTSLLSLQNSKTFKLLQHPPATGALKSAAPEVALPMYLTEKERKRIRKQRRMAIEQEKRDKQMMGLIPAPEPKFKLSNFMRILGDQAIADPSKVEQKVIEQVRARELKHEMDNLARKLTPVQRREKKINKVKVAAEQAREIHVAVFSVSDLQSPKLRFKIDMNAQQWQLTGTVVLCREGHCNMVYVEGGDRAIRKFSHLMLNRAKWGYIPTEAELAAGTRSKDSAVGDHAAVGGTLQVGKNSSSSAMEMGSDEDDDNDEDDEDSDQDAGDGHDDGSKQTNVCRLIWSGIGVKRTFNDFKFRETVTAAGARHVLEEYLLHSYWDMAVAQQ